jgi:TatD DNase family protein
MNLFVDSHCHFDFPAFTEVPEVRWGECLSAGVAQLVIPGVTPKQWPLAAQLSNSLTGVYWAAGLHPWWIDEQLESLGVLKAELATALAPLWQQLQLCMTQTGCVALGECGLDKTITTDFALQQQLLTVQLQIAKAMNKPVILHAVKAHSETLQLLKQQRLPLGGVVHGFSGSIELAQAYWSLGFHLGVGGTISYARAQKTRATLAKMPLESLVLETDAPSMPLNGRQGQINSPRYIPEIAQYLADLRGANLATIAAQTSINAQRLFRLPSVQGPRALSEKFYVE